MDPISIISLVGTCASLATRVVTTAGQIDEFLQSYRAADRSIASLSTTLRLFGESLTQLRSWLEQEPAVSHNLRRTIKGSVDDCEVVLDHLEEHVSSVVRSTRAGKSSSTLAGLGFGRKLKHIWNANTVAKHETRLNSQVHTVMHLVNFVKLNNTDQQDSAVDTAETRTIISRSANEANIIRSLRDGSSIREDRTVYTNVGDHDKELEVDEELIRSPAYIAQYRTLMRGRPTSSSKSGSTSNSSKPPDGESGSLQDSPLAVPGKSSRRSGNSFFKSLTWSRSPESRNLAALLCQAAMAGNIKWMENLLDEGAYVNGWVMDDDKKATWEYSLDASSRTPPTGRRTPLILAAMNKRHEAFRFLLDRGANLEAKDSEGKNVWHYLVEYDPDFCTGLMEININPPADSLCVLLRKAIDAERVDILKLLLKRASRRHANAECKIKRGLSDTETDATILWRAMEKKNLDMVKLLVEKGADIDERVGFLRIQGWDLDDGFLEVSARTPNAGPTPLFSVVSDTARLDLVKYLVSMGASITAKTDLGDQHGVTPLHVARGACAEFLVSKGAKVFAMDSRGQTPLFWAIGFWPEPDPEAVLANLAQGSPTNIVDKNGFSPLVLLARRLSFTEWVSEKTLENYRRTADALIDAGAVRPQKEQATTSDISLIYSRLMGKKTYVDMFCRTGHLYDTEFKTEVYGLYLGGLRQLPQQNGSRLIWPDGDPSQVPQTAQLRAGDGTMMSGPFQIEHVTIKRNLFIRPAEPGARRITGSFLDLCDLLVPDWAR